MKKEVTVLGGGIVAMATAAECARAGFTVTMFELPQFADKVQAIKEKGGVQLSGVLGNTFEKIHCVTTDPREALQKANLVFLAVPAFAHEAFMQACMPYFQASQTIVTQTAYFSCLRFAKAIKATGKDIILAEMNQAPYCASLTGPASIFIDAKREKTHLAALPANKTHAAMKAPVLVYPELIPAANVIDTSLYNVNWVIHPVVSLFFRGLIDRSAAFSMPVKDSLSCCVVRLMDAIEHERLAIGKAFGLDLTPIKNTYELGGKDLEEALRNSTEFQTFNWEYFDSTNQYLKEDLYFALPVIASLADLVGVPTPAIHSILEIFSIIDGIDYRQKGINVEKLGLSGMKTPDLMRLLESGY